MNIKVILLGFTIFTFATFGLAENVIAQATQKQLMDYQKDADLARLEHILYWTDLIEEYQQKTGSFPFQNSLTSSKPGFVRIVTKAQQEYFDPQSDKYISKIDNNARGSFQQFSIVDFVAELEKGLGREIEEKYDIQNVPSKTTIGYNYFVTEDGYLVWVPCITCGVTPVSTLLLDGYTPTVNIASEGMVGSVTKAYTRDDMIAHPIFKDWMARGYIKEGYVRHVEQQNARDSKASP